MFDLRATLRALGVSTGAHDLPAPAPRPASPPDLEAILHGAPRPTPLGETYCVDNHWGPDYRHGRDPLGLTARRDLLARWAAHPEISDLSPEAFAFIDTETTGLSGGSGTYAFLIGVGRFEGATFHLAQFFLRDPAEEPAQLAALEEFLAPTQVLVSYNGKAFDLPLLHTRYRTHGLRPIFRAYPHLDLLHLARRLYRDRLPSRTLGNLEAHILGALRTGEDVPGWAIPALYFQYLNSGDASPLAGVFYHNAMDVVSLAALLDRFAALLTEPVARAEAAVELPALARLYEDLGEIDAAADLYLHALARELPEPVLRAALLRLAALYKRRGQLEPALALWQRAADLGDLSAHLELAKCAEHQQRDLVAALRWTRAALDLTARTPSSQPSLAAADLLHRLARLERKWTSQPTPPTPPSSSI
jgi:uncharacterized protein YprB with RNaseH-like and TPR domain